VPAVDEVVPLKWRGSVLDRRPFDTDTAQLADVGADVAILLPNSFAVAWLARRAAIPERWGYATDMRGLLLSKAIRRPTRRMHQGAYYQHLVEALGMPPGPLTPALSIPDGSIAAARRLLVERGWRGTGPVVVLAAGAAYGTAKRWVPAHVATLARGLIADRGATCVLVGSAADRATMTIVHELMPANPDLIDLTGDTTLDGLGGVLTLADVCVSNDSGAMHIAAAVGTPLAALFGPTREQETAPLTRAGGRAEVLINPVWCRPCMLRECPIDHRCMTGLTPERVRRTVDALLERAR
jgi:heptosyltransferase-2